nr:tetratricopeptide repeat protein [Pseudomonas insulae]
MLVSGALLTGCATNPRGSIPVVDSSAPLSEEQESGAIYRQAQAPTRAQPTAEDSGVVVMVPQQSSGQVFAAPSAPISGSIDGEPMTPGPVTGSQPTYTPSYSSPAPVAPSGIPSASSAGGLAADEQLDGPVLALLTTAQQQQGGGDLNGAASSLERAQRIAPREPQVLYKLAEVRLAQGDAAQAEQLAQRALTYAGGRPSLQASLWELIAKSRERRGDVAGASQARQQTRVNL